MKGIEVFPTNPAWFYRWLESADISVVKALNERHSVMDETFPIEFAWAIRCKIAGCYNRDSFVRISYDLNKYLLSNGCSTLK